MYTVNRRISRSRYDRKFKERSTRRRFDSSLADYKKPEELVGENRLLEQLAKSLVERTLYAEMFAHLAPNENAPVGVLSAAVVSNDTGAVIPPISTDPKSRTVMQLWPNAASG